MAFGKPLSTRRDPDESLSAKGETLSSAQVAHALPMPRGRVSPSGRHERSKGGGRLQASAASLESGEAPAAYATGGGAEADDDTSEARLRGEAGAPAKRVAALPVEGALSPSNCPQ